MKVYKCLGGGMGTPYTRRCGIPQGCSFSMMYVALIMRPWIILMRYIPGIQAFILAEDVFVLATGTCMIGNVAQAINQTHEYLHTMGPKPHLAKSRIPQAHRRRGSGLRKRGGRAFKPRLRSSKTSDT